VFSTNQEISAPQSVTLVFSTFKLLAAKLQHPGNVVRVGIIRVPSESTGPTRAFNQLTVTESFSYSPSINTALQYPNNTGARTYRRLNKSKLQNYEWPFTLQDRTRIFRKGTEHKEQGGYPMIEVLLPSSLGGGSLLTTVLTINKLSSIKVSFS
jgi:hypothetical protein